MPECPALVMASSSGSGWSVFLSPYPGPGAEGDRSVAKDSHCKTFHAHISRSGEVQSISDEYE